MPGPARGSRTSTYEILELIDVDPDGLTLTVRHAAANKPATFSLDRTTAPAAQQILRAIAQSLVVATDSDADSRWTSLVTLQNSVWMTKHMLKEMLSLGIESFSDPTLDVVTLRMLYRPFSSSHKRTACWLLARAVREHHPDGHRLAYALKNSRFQVEDRQGFTYDIEVAADIERVGRRVLLDAYRAQRDVFHTMGFEVKGRAWLRVAAEDIIAAALAAHPGIDRQDEEPPSAADTSKQIAWALTHPHCFGYRRYARQPLVAGREMRRIGRALYPDNATLTGAAIVHCLAEHAGYNLAVILEKSADSLTYLGDDEALERSIKARNSTEDHRATRLGSLFTSGGVTETLTGLTRFTRHHRAGANGEDGASPMNHRLYVEHVPNPEDAKVLGSDRIQHAWRHGAVFEQAWAEENGAADIPSLRLSGLRMEAQRRLLNAGLNADVHGHTERTKTHYLAHVLPNHVLHDLATRAQDSFHDSALKKFQFQSVAHATDGVAGELAAAADAGIMDVEIGVCTTGGDAPEGGRRCDLGMVACFTCPNGYRTVDHVPGLLAAVEFADIVEANDPDEWANGQAADLKFYARASLEAFPRPVVTNIARSTDLTPHILTVTGMYMELRHG